MSIAIKSGAKVLYQWERGVALTASTPCDILRISREDDRVTDDLYPVISGSTGTALIPDRMLTESGYLHVSRIDLADGSERVLETVRILVRSAAKPQTTSSSTKEVGDMQALRMQMAALERAAREGKFDGKDGITPHVGENGNWFAGDVDLGVHAQGNKGDKGDPGDTPYVGANGNWFVGDFDTGVKAKSEDVSLYAEDLYTSGVLVTDDLESFVMTGTTSDTGTPQLITSPGVVYIKGIRRRFAKSTRTFHVPGKERVSVQYIRLNEITGEIEQQNWEDVIIDGDIHNGGTITGIETGILPRRSGGYYDVILCIVTLPAGATEVTPDMIRDLRGDERYCGFVRSKVDGGAKALTEHNVSETAHNDIRLLLSGLTERLNAIADSDDTTLDQLSEIVAYIKANKTLIESVTTSKVNVSDIIDNLTTRVSNKPLSAKMGVELRGLISTVENSANNAVSQASSAQSMASSAMNHASSAEEIASSAMNHASSAEEIASSAMAHASSAEQMASAAQAEIEKLKENGVPGGGAGTSVNEVHIGADEPTDGEKLWIDLDDDGDGLTAEDVKNALGYTPANAEAVGELSEAIADKVSKTGITLGLHSDGKYYIFVDGTPVGTGLELSGNSGDVFGYVDANNNIILNGNLADGNYSIKYEMEDEDGNVTTIDIGDLILDTNVYYSVISTLTNCTSSNSATQVIEGESYSATITANDGYELSSVAVTMGGNPVTVSDGSINIAEVTGNIVIIATAEEKVAEVEPTNFAEYNAENTTDWNIWINSARVGSDGKYRSDTYDSNYGTPAVSNYIAVQNGDVVEFEGMYVANKNSVLYDSNKALLTSGYVGLLTNLTDRLSNVSIDNNNFAGTFTINSADVGYVRIGGYVGTPSHPVSEISIKIKRNGEYL